MFKKELHPCFSEEAHMRYARVHLPVARKCNMCCKYCARGLSKTGDHPGLTAEILCPEKAIEKVQDALKKYPVTVVGIAGPGDALANEETFTTLKLLDKNFPELLKCMCTNGLLLPQKLELLKAVHLNALTVTVNAIDKKVAIKLYDFIRYDGKIIKGEEACKILIENQYDGVKKAIAAGIAVKINMVLVPKINMEQAVEIAKRYGAIGTELMNIMPLIPLAKFRSFKPPTQLQVDTIRARCEKYIPQFRKCRRCRADACGIPGEEAKRGLC
ncbi:MAG: radical SAM protein [Candidatus Thermoplasmatota archaeon]